MSAPGGSEIVEPRMLLLPAGNNEQTTDAAAAPNTTPSQEPNDPFALSQGSPGSSSIDLSALMNDPNINAAPTNPVATTTVAGTAQPLFGPYACHLPRFDLKRMAEGLYDRDRTFAPPQGDDVERVRAGSEAYVKSVREALITMPANPNPLETQMCDEFVRNMTRIDERDVVATQIACQIVDSVLTLHEPSAVGESSMEGFVEGEDGELTVGRIEVAAKPDVIGDHLRRDQIEALAPFPEDFNLTASARLEKICDALRQTKGVAIGVFYGKDGMTRLAAAPFKVQASYYPEEQRAQMAQEAQQWMALRAQQQMA